MDLQESANVDLDKLELMKVEANGLFSKSEYESALKIYYNILKSILKLDSSNIDAEYIKNQSKICVNNVTHSHLKKFISTVLCNMGLCYNRIENKQEAKTLFQASLLFDEYNYKANYNIVHSFLSAKDYNMTQFHINMCDKIVKSDPNSWQNRHKPHLDLMDKVRQSLRSIDLTRNVVNEPKELVDKICNEVDMSLNIQRLQLVNTKKLVQSECILDLIEFCQTRLQDGLVDDVLVSVWSCLYHILYKSEDEFKYDLSSQFISKFGNNECSLYNYVKNLLNMYHINPKPEIVSVVSNISKCCPLVKGVDCLKTLTALLESDRVDLDVTLSSVLLYFSKAGNTSNKYKDSSFNILLSNLLQKLVSLCDDDYSDHNNQLEACLMAIFRMDFDSYEVTQDSFTNMVNSALEPYLCTQLDPSGNTLISFEHNWYVAMKCLFLANKTCFKAYIVINCAIKHLARVYFTVYSEKFRKLSFELLLNCVDFVEFRQELLDYDNDGKSLIESLNSPEFVKFTNELINISCTNSKQKSLDDGLGDVSSGRTTDTVSNRVPESVNSRLELSRWFVESCVLMYAKLSLHSPQVKDDILNRFNLFAILPKMVLCTLNNGLDQDLVLHTLSFASLHEEFKLSDLSFIPVLIEKLKKSDLSTMMLVQTISNLLRGNKDRNSFLEDLDMVKYDHDQLKQLKILQEKLPAQAKLTSNGNYFEGDEKTTQKARSLVFNMSDFAVASYLSKTFKSTSSDTVKSLLIEPLHYLALDVVHRRYLQSLGVMRIFINVANSSKYQLRQNKMAPSYRSMTRYKLVVQSIAHLCISTSPSNLNFNDAQDSIQPLMNLLEDENELYKYEAALALTNLLSINDAIRKRVFSLNGWDKFSNLLFSDNEMLKTAALQGWCNLCAGDDVVHSHFYFKIKPQIDNTPESSVYQVNIHDINIMLMFIAPNITADALSAASGAFALLVKDGRIAQYMPFVSRFENVLKTLDDTSDEAILHRLLTILSCVVLSRPRDLNQVNEAHVESVFKNIRDTVRHNSHKYTNKTLSDLFHEIC